MKILLVGGSDKANYLTPLLKNKGHDLTIINNDAELCKELSDTHKISAVHGDGTQPNILETAGISTMDAVIGLDSRDERNLIVCELAKRQFNIKSTFAVVNDPKNVKLFTSLGVSKYICAAQLMADAIEHEGAVENLKNYFPIGKVTVRVCEVELDEKSPVLSKKLWEIVFPKDSIVGCVVRREKIIIPQGSTELKAGDKVIVLSSPESLEKAVLLLTGEKSPRMDRR